MSLADLPLSEAARAALARAIARPLSYAVRAYAVPVPPGAPPRTLVVLGEAHVKLAEASEIGHAVVDAFALRGVETFQIKRVVAGRLLGPLIHIPRRVLRFVTFGAVKDSTIVDAKQLGHGATVEIERTKRVPLSLHVASVYLTAFFGVAWAQLALTAIGAPWLLTWPLTLGVVGFEVHFLALFPAVLFRRRRWAWLLHPAIAIVTARDTIMADGTAEMLKDYPDVDAAIVVMGRAHLPGFERELVQRYGFKRLDS